MKILFWKWNAFMQDGMEKALQRLNADYETLYFQPDNWEQDERFERAVEEKLKSKKYDRVISVNFAPIVSKLCEKYGVVYAAWIYDSPVHIRDKSSFNNSCNRIYMFDRGQAEICRMQGYSQVRHMVLAADESVWKIRRDKRYDCDVAFVGQLYKSDYDYLMRPLSGYYRGVVDGYAAAQEQLEGGYILSELITDELMEELNVFYRKASGGDFEVKKEELEYACACEVTGRQRFMAMALLGSRCRVNLFSGDTDERLGAVNQCGYVDYYSQMPAVFSQAKINLNISLKTIRTGIPLRVLDILSCGGFLITNYQEELFEYFEPDVDLVVYSDVKDMVQKVTYYLRHDTERREIAENGRKKVRQSFGFDAPVKRLITE